MRINFIGSGRLGTTALYATMLMSSGHEFFLTELLKGAQEKNKAQYLDLLPVANATKNTLEYCTEIKDANLYVITAGQPRTVNMSKADLFNINMPIIINIVQKCNPDSKKIIATNPPDKICDNLVEYDFYSESYGLETDRLRAKALGFKSQLRGTHDEVKCDDPKCLNAIKSMNEIIMLRKGYTNWTAAFGLARRVLEVLR